MSSPAPSVPAVGAGTTTTPPPSSRICSCICFMGRLEAAVYKNYERTQNTSVKLTGRQSGRAAAQSGAGRQRQGFCLRASCPRRPHQPPSSTYDSRHTHNVVQQDDPGFAGATAPMNYRRSSRVFLLTTCTWVGSFLLGASCFLPPAFRSNPLLDTELLSFRPKLCRDWLSPVREMTA